MIPLKASETNSHACVVLSEIPNPPSCLRGTFGNFRKRPAGPLTISENSEVVPLAR